MDREDSYRRRGWRRVVSAAQPCICLLLVVLLEGTMVSPAVGQADSSAAGMDLTGLSIEQLIKVEVIPIDASGSHIHAAGEWMVGYGYTYARMEGGTQHGEGAHGSAVMDMAMQMASVMYGLTNRLTLMVMAPYRSMTMQGEHGMAMTSAGLGDVGLGAHYALRRGQPVWLIATLGVSLPTGSIDERSEGGGLLAPLMQPGSGTMGLKSGIDVIRQKRRWTLGVHSDATIRLGTNARSYRLGSTFHVGGWATWLLRDWIAPFVHLNAEHTTALHAAEALPEPQAMPLNTQASSHVEVQPGISLYVPRGLLEGQRLELLTPVPLFATHEGPHLDRRWRLHLAWQWTF